MRNPDKLLLIAFVFAVIITLFSQVSADEQQLTIIVYTEDGKRLPGAIVKLDGQNDTTNSNGEVQFQINTTDTYQIKVYYPSGYLVCQYTISNYNQSTYRANASVVSEWTIIVKDGKGRDPISGANVTIVLRSDSSIRYSKLTGSDGEVTFGPIPSEEYDITVRYKDIEREFTHKKPEVNLTEGIVEPLSLSLPLYRVTLTVEDVNEVPVKDVKVELRPELDEDPIASATTNANGKAVLKLIPNGRYYVVAFLKDVKVYESEGKEIRVSGDDVEKTIKVNAAKLNITVYEYDGEREITDYTLRGELIKDDTAISEANSINGVLRFSHTPFTNYTLKVYLGDILVYSGTYEVTSDTSQGSIKAWFYDIQIEVNASILANETIAKSLKVEFYKDPVRVEVQTEEGEATLKDLPRAEGYLVTLFYQDKKVGEIPGINIVEENQVVRLNLTGYRINFTTVNLDNEPIGVNISISLPEGEKVLSINTGPDGKGSSGMLLPLTYEITAYLGGIKVGEQTLALTSDVDLRMELSVINTAFKILDKDGETTLTNIDLQLSHGSLKLAGTSNEEGIIEIKNIPVAHYRLIANYHGFKVLDQPIDIQWNTREVELRAAGVLDVKLVMLDALKKPLDQGSVILSFGDIEVEKNISSNGEAVIKNLPNTTIDIRAFYKGVEVDTDPVRFNLVKDEMRVVCVTSVYTITIKVLRGDGEPVNEGEALIYVDGELKAAHDLSSSNTFSERLPRSDVKIQILYRKRDAGFMEIYLEQPMGETALYSHLYPFKIRIYDPEGKPVEGAELVIKDKFGEIERAQSGGDGSIESVLPVGTYNASIQIENNTYSFEFEFRTSRSINFLYPVSHNHGFEISVAAGAVNLAISSFALSKIPRERPRRRPARRRAAARRPRRVPRV